MVEVVLGSMVSIGVTLFALSAIAGEFKGRWAQIGAALAFDENAYAAPQLREIRRSAVSARAWPAPARVGARQRAAA
jgi:hypothetical protein